MDMKVRLSLMNFLEFAVWGAYLTCMGNYLGVAGLGAQISWFYAIQGIVSIFMPTLMGIVADRYMQPQRVLGLCHLLAGGFMLGCWWMGLQAGFGNELPNKSAFIAMYTLSVAFFMPTIALANTTAFTILKSRGFDTVTDFPPIRVLGTVGFIITMWFVNCAVWEDGSFSFTLAENAHKFQYTYMQFFVSGLLSLVLYVIRNKRCNGYHLVLLLGCFAGAALMFSGSIYGTLFSTGRAWNDMRSLTVDLNSGILTIIKTLHMRFVYFFPHQIWGDQWIPCALASILLAVKCSHSRWKGRLLFLAGFLVFALYFVAVRFFGPIENYVPRWSDVLTQRLNLLFFWFVLFRIRIPSCHIVCIPGEAPVRPVAGPSGHPVDVGR